MIVFKKVRMKNFLSVGPQWVELTLNTHRITSISGENGSAKSAICIDSIYYALYGKSFRHANIPRMVNSTTKKGMLVELEFENMGNSCKVVRGIKPNVFEIWINGKLKEQSASAKDYQSFLSKHLLKMDEKTFRQIVVIGSSSYIPFMSLSAGDRRTVVEQLLNLDVFESLNDLIKQGIKDADDQKYRLSQKKSEVEMKISFQRKHNEDAIQKHLDELRSHEKEMEGLIARKEELEKSIKEAMASLDRKGYEESKQKLAKFDEAIQKGSQWKARKRFETSERDKQKKFFTENCTCPTCFQELNKSFVEQKLNQLNEAEEASKKELAVFEEKLNAIVEQKEKISVWLSEVSKKSMELNRLASEKDAVVNSISFIERRKLIVEQNIDEERKLAGVGTIELENELEAVDKEIQKIADLMEIYDFFIQEFKDSGVKARVVSSHLAIINQLVSKYLKIVGFEIGFKFDETFNESISTNGIESFEYSNYSEGEKLRINCAILFSFRELAKIRSCVSTNILVLDEFDQGTLDEDGFTSVVNILKSCENQNIFIISHSTSEFDQISDRSLVARKVNGFSEIFEN